MRPIGHGQFLSSSKPDTEANNQVYRDHSRQNYMHDTNILQETLQVTNIEITFCPLSIESFLKSENLTSYLFHIISNEKENRQSKENGNDTVLKFTCS